MFFFTHMIDIFDELRRFNPWWGGVGPNLPEGFIERDIFRDLVKGLGKTGVQSITGLRRVGKTTLMMQIIEHLLDDVDPERILYFSFDFVPSDESPTVRDIIEEYLTRTLGSPLMEITDPVYVFLDEVHVLESWSREVKYYVDLQTHLRFVVTGSSSMHIERGAGESLVGRMNINHLYPFSFREFLAYHGILIEEEFDLFSMIQHDDVMCPSFSNGERLRIEFEGYLKSGGLPELHHYNTEMEKRNFVRTCVDLTLYRDVLAIFPTRQPKRLVSLFYFLISNSGRVVNYATMSNALGMKYETLQTYLEYLERSHLIRMVTPYSVNILKQMSRNPKIYIGDHSFFLLNGTDEGHVVETIAFNHIRRLAGQRITKPLHFWVNKKGEEVDMIILTEEGIVPLEVKYRSSIQRNDLKGLLDFMRKNDAMPPTIITKDDEGIMEVKGRNGPRRILKIPLWKFLLSR